MNRAAVTREPAAREEKLRGHNILELQTKVHMRVALLLVERAF